ncbi:MAG TPA: DUF4377 domain-containing protein [Prolixibacteraceae bacterium]|nr:DUF4377 domain-containing protein [Prolixibacteraceae bacterium]
MKKIYLVAGFLVLILFFSGCLKEESGDKEKIVEMTVYPETGYSGYFMSDNVWGEFLVISDSNDKNKRLLTFSITEGFSDFNYEKGYEYKLQVKKIWMKEPPQDVSSIKYVYLETLSREKVINEDSESEIEVSVAAEKVRFIPRLADESTEALFVREKGSVNGYPILDIEGFDYEEGFEYTLRVKKMTQAEPYAVKYILLDILSKGKTN